jgi:glycosyltransferase involved in cell wall biosynthesis
MRFAVFTHVEHIRSANKIYAYGPYVREMNVWLSHIKDVEILAPIKHGKINPIHLKYEKDNIILNRIPGINILSFSSALKLFYQLPIILLKIVVAMYRADHIHIRSPGNIALIACILQIFFPKKKKTAKYAGNWDPNSVQPWSYTLQKKILSNTFLTKNIKVLVYGNWEQQSKNIVPFFTATFLEKDKVRLEKNYVQPYKFIFVGSLVSGKNPLYAIKLIESLNKSGISASLNLYGEGWLKKQLISYVTSKNLDSFIFFNDNLPLNRLKGAYSSAHFVILASKSEGWPKAIAEGMFYGCIPIATSVSCMPWMLGEGQRGLLISEDLNKSVHFITKTLKNKSKLRRLSKDAQIWSQKYTLNKFQSAIKDML